MLYFASVPVYNTIINKRKTKHKHVVIVSDLQDVFSSK